MEEFTVVRDLHTDRVPVWRDLLLDSTLSFGARGLMAALLCKPAGWELRPAELVEPGVGIDRLKRLLGELVRAGYLQRERVHDVNGHWAWQWHIIAGPPQPRPVPSPQPEVTGKTQQAIYQRDRSACQYCGATDAPAYEIDHVIPRSLGGNGARHNLVLACEACNQRKGATVWIPRNLDAITINHPQWREQVQALAVSHV